MVTFSGSNNCRPPLWRHQNGV